MKFVILTCLLLMTACHCPPKPTSAATTTTVESIICKDTACWSKNLIILDVTGKTVLNTVSIPGDKIVSSSTSVPQPTLVPPDIISPPPSPPNTSPLPLKWKQPAQLECSPSFAVRICPPDGSDCGTNQWNGIDPVPPSSTTDNIETGDLTVQLSFSARTESVTQQPISFPVEVLPVCTSLTETTGAWMVIVGQKTTVSMTWKDLSAAKDFKIVYLNTSSAGISYSTNSTSAAAMVAASNDSNTSTIGGNGSLTNTPSCTDQIKDGTETDIDCGGSCPVCSTGKNCLVASNCVTNICTSLVCTAPTCSDGLKNGSETDIDCSGSCPSCATGKSCLIASNCVTNICTSLVCTAPTCSDGLKNGSETDIDCGGSCGATCSIAKTCSTYADCSTGLCFATLCIPCTANYLAGTPADCPVSLPTCSTGTCTL